MGPEAPSQPAAFPEGKNKSTGVESRVVYLQRLGERSLSRGERSLSRGERSLSRGELSLSRGESSEGGAERDS